MVVQDRVRSGELKPMARNEEGGADSHKKKSQKKKPIGEGGGEKAPPPTSELIWLDKGVGSTGGRQGQDFIKFAHPDHADGILLRDLIVEELNEMDHQLVSTLDMQISDRKNSTFLMASYILEHRLHANLLLQIWSVLHEAKQLESESLEALKGISNQYPRLLKASICQKLVGVREAKGGDAVREAEESLGGYLTQVVHAFTKAGIKLPPSRLNDLITGM